MAAFDSEQELYDTLGRAFEELLADPHAGPRLQRADTVVQFRTHDPEAAITIDLRVDVEPVVAYRPLGAEPEVVLSMAAETAHRLFVGEINITAGLARGLIRAEGPVGRVLRLVPLLRASCPRYAEQVDRGGQAVPA